MSDRYDLAIIGAGSGGLVGATFAARAGARVALIEKHRVGGDCTWTGCVPSKALLKVAKVAHQARTAGRFGLRAALEPVNLKAVMDYARQSIQHVYQYESPAVLRDKGIDLFMGQARFVDPHTLDVASGDGDQRRLTAKNILICSGARALIPDVEGLADVPWINYETVFDLEVLPERLLVLGGGPVGVEMTQAFARLGSRVQVFQSQSRLLPRDEPEAAEVLANCLREEGATLHLGVAVTGVKKSAAGITLQTEGAEFTGDALLVAAGRRPNVETMALEKAGVHYTAEGVPVDDNLQTSVKHIYAAGDVLGGPQFTHYAGFQAFYAARNALFPGSSKGVVQSVPWTTFTDPEVAHAGLTEAEARQRYGDDIGVRLWQMEHVDRAVTEGDTAGFIKAVHRKDGAVIGATVVAGRAGEVIHEWVLAIAHNWKIGDLSGTIHVYPTYSIANQQLASEYAIESLLGSTFGKIMKGLSGLK